MKKRLKSIDLIKFIAILLIILFHLIYNLGYTNTRWIGFLGVSIFFIASGFLLKKETSPK